MVEQLLELPHVGLADRIACERLAALLDTLDRVEARLAKAGVAGLTKSLGKELAGTGVLCNAVAPAAARTEIFAQMTEQHIAWMLSRIPMGRFVEVDEIAALVAWLASEDCSFSTGALYDISGGRATY